jgi:hypothetical protein
MTLPNATYQNKIGLLLIASSLVALLLPQFFNSYVLADYMLNTEYYATVLCKNQDKPALACKGKCSLKDKFDTNNQLPQGITTLLEKQMEIMWVDFGYVGKSNSVAQHLAAQTSPFITNFSLSSYSTDVFRPPCL